MTIFVFEVREKAVDAGVHTWMAVERSSGTEFPLPHGGNTVAGRSFVGEYPEIQDFLQRAYRLDLRIVYDGDVDNRIRSEEHTSELQSLMRISYAVFCLTKKIPHTLYKYSSTNHATISYA